MHNTYANHVNNTKSHSYVPVSLQCPKTNKNNHNIYIYIYIYIYNMHNTCANHVNDTINKPSCASITTVSQNK